MRKLIIIFFFIILIFSINSCKENEDLYDVESSTEAFNNIKLGYNLGMSFSACIKDQEYEMDTIEKVKTYELKWCNTITTKDIFLTLKNKGFNALRIAIDITNHLNEDDIIDHYWLERIKEVVSWCLDLKIYVILSLVETYGLKLNNQDKDIFINSREIQRFIQFWGILADNFSSYNGYLLFEPFNELRNENGDWGTDDKKIYDNLLYLYQLFIKTIRDNKEYNKKRNLVLPTYAASSNKDILKFTKKPIDYYQNHLIFDVHYYNPIRFTFNEINLGSTNFIDTWGTKEDITELYLDMNNIRINLAKRLNVPVIIGECGAVRRTDINERIKYHKNLKNFADSNNLKLFIFDDSWDFLYLNRETLEFVDEEIIDLLLK